MTDAIYKQIADDLRRRIQRGDLAPGDDIPTESELASRWRTSRGPIRNALAELRNEGLIETARGRPARVVERKAVQRVDLVVPFTRWARDMGAVPGAHTVEIALRRADAVQAQSLAVDVGTPVVDVLRLRSLDGRPTMLERLTYLESVGRMLFDADLDVVSITEYLESRGVVSSSVQHEIDAVAADDTDAELLEVEIGSPLLRLRRISQDAEGVPFEASDDRYLSEIVRFTVWASGRSATGDHYIRALGATT
jgi:GntR family transcriptional regulator